MFFLISEVVAYESFNCNLYCCNNIAIVNNGFIIVDFTWKWDIIYAEIPLAVILNLDHVLATTFTKQSSVSEVHFCFHGSTIHVC